MSCIKKYGMTPEEILKIKEGRGFGESMYLYEMRKDAYDELKLYMKLKYESDKAMTIPNFDKLIVPLFKSQPITITQSYTQINESTKEIKLIEMKNE